MPFGKKKDVRPFSVSHPRYRSEMVPAPASMIRNRACRCHRNVATGMFVASVTRWAILAISSWLRGETNDSAGGRAMV